MYRLVKYCVDCFKNVSSPRHIDRTLVRDTEFDRSCPSTVQPVPILAHDPMGTSKRTAEWAEYDEQDVLHEKRNGGPTMDYMTRSEVERSR